MVVESVKHFASRVAAMPFGGVQRLVSWSVAAGIAYAWIKYESTPKVEPFSQDDADKWNKAIKRKEKKEKKKQQEREAAAPQSTELKE